MRLSQPDLHKSLTSENALVIVLGACLLLMGRHVYHVYNAGAWGYIAAIGLSVATMQFILRGHQWRGYVFALLDMMYNLAFFHLLTPLLRGQLSADNASEFLLSVAIPVVLAFYAHDYANKKVGEKGNQSFCVNQDETPTHEPATLMEVLGVKSIPTPPNISILEDTKQAQEEINTDVVRVYADPLPPAPPTPKPLPLPKKKPTASNKARVLAYLNKHGEMSPKAIVEALGVPYGTASGYLNEWRKGRANVSSMATGD